MVTSELPGRPAHGTNQSTNTVLIIEPINQYWDSWDYWHREGERETDTWEGSREKGLADSFCRCCKSESAKLEVAIFISDLVKVPALREPVRTLRTDGDAQIRSTGV